LKKLLDKSCHHRKTELPPDCHQKRGMESGLEMQKATFYSSFLSCAPLTDERCSYNKMIEYVTIRKING